MLNCFGFFTLASQRNDELGRFACQPGGYPVVVWPRSDDEGTSANVRILPRATALRDQYYQALREAEVQTVLLEKRVDNQASNRCACCDYTPGKMTGISVCHMAAMCFGVVSNRQALHGSENQTELRGMALF